jgi:outer membrane murein-binding lipoprotein Lpp
VVSRSGRTAAREIAVQMVIGAVVLVLLAVAVAFALEAWLETDNQRLRQRFDQLEQK